MGRQFTPEMGDLNAMTAYTNLGIALLKQENIEKRCLGIKMIKSQLNKHCMVVGFQDKINKVIMKVL